MNIKYAAKLPTEVPSSVTVYKLAAPQASTAQVAAMSQRFGLTGKMREFISSEDWTSYNEGRYRVAVHRNSGALRYVHVDKYGVEPLKDFKISKDKVADIAKTFLKRAKLVPDGQSRLYKVTYLRSAVSDLKGKEKSERLIDAGVIYRRLVDGISVEGPGGYAMVNVDPEAEVVGLRSVWRPTTTREAKVKIMPVGQARETFEKLISNVIGDVTVTGANFGYFEQSEMDKQTYLEPAYVFIYTVQNGEVAHKSIEVLPAGDKTFAKLTLKKRFDGGEQKKRPADKK